MPQDRNSDFGNQQCALKKRRTIAAPTCAGIKPRCDVTADSDNNRIFLFRAFRSGIRLRIASERHHNHQSGKGDRNKPLNVHKCLHILLILGAKLGAKIQGNVKPFKDVREKTHPFQKRV